jgi:hypothetical protein
VPISADFTGIFALTPQRQICLSQGVFNLAPNPTPKVTYDHDKFIYDVTVLKLTAVITNERGQGLKRTQE